MSEKTTEADRPQPTPVLTNDKWVAALGTLSEEDRERFTFAKTGQRSARDVLADVLEATRRKKNECIKKRWRVVVRGRSIILRDVLEKISVWVSKVVKFGDIAIQYDPGQAALPWTAIRLILQATVNDVEVFGWILDSIENITNLLATCAIFELRYLSNPNSKSLDTSDQINNALISLYANILLYLSEVIRYYAQGSALRFVKSVVSPVAIFEAKYAPIRSARAETWLLAQLAEAEKSERTQASLDRIESCQDSTATALFETLGDALRELQQPISRASIQLAEIQDGLERETRTRILRSISSIPYSMHQKHAKKGRLEGSGQWLLRKPEYKSWRQSSTSSVLLLHGIPGSGKTKLTSLVIDELRGHDNIAYFYCMRNPAEPQRGRGDQILASLVRQLAGVSSDQPILAPVVTQYEDAVSGLCDFEDQVWTADECGRVLLELMEEYPAATIVLDALDEVNQEDRQELLDILSWLLEKSPNLLKMFISSRDNYDIALHFESSPKIYIDADDNAGDISSFIDDRLNSARLLHNRLPKDLEAEIRETLLRGARGMFRWVDLQIQSLRPLKLAADIEARLGVLPPTLEGSYWEIYQAIHESGDHAAALADITFRWLIFAQDTVTAEVFACIASSTMQQLKTTTAVAAGVGAAEVIDVCSNLVTSRNGSFEFAHLSVREFFEGVYKRGVDRFLPINGNSCIATACLRHLHTHIKTLGPQLMKQDEEHDDVQFVTLYDATEPDGNTNTTVTTITKDETNPAEAPQPQPQPPPPPLPPPLQISKPRPPPDSASTALSREIKAVRYAARFWVHHACESGEMRTRDPLAAAIREFLGKGAVGVSFRVGGEFEVWCRVVQDILKREKYEAGRDEKQFNLLKDATEEPANPFWLACLYGWHDLVDFLIECKYEHVDEPRRLDSLDNREKYSFSGSKVSPLIYAILDRRLVLISKMWSYSEASLLKASLLQPKDKPKFKPLVKAAGQGDAELVALLLRMEHGGLDVEGEAFATAASNNHCETMEMLLAHEPRALSGAGNHALREACVAGHTDAVTFLLDRNVPLMNVGLHLCRAVFMGHHEVLKILLERNLGRDSVSKALIIAVSHDDQASTDLLLRYGAEKEPHAVTREAKLGNRGTAVRLIEAGYDIRGRYLEKQRTALHYAAEGGYEDVVRALLSAGAPVNVRDGNQKTPLHLAAERGRAACVGLLLGHGAEVLAKDAGGRIPLDLAQERNHKATETLIRAGMMKLMGDLIEKQ
ncbi:uncharacterized protein B0H64DRAFT_83679 [Chaetomium fimeti]|uniref:NACHT domain-containing protein n=1 Tax=Chaetomium fimeti TaxID=1854472 RepID=A0AAE0LVH1_9PEZI|nr:hypothetical protein B0H64DRAFT_83679 [Chaetomium fimeti]